MKIIKQSMSYTILRDVLTQNTRIIVILMICTIKGQNIATKLACCLKMLSIWKIKEKNLNKVIIEWKMVFSSTFV